MKELVQRKSHWITGRLRASTLPLLSDKQIMNTTETAGTRVKRKGLPFLNQRGNPAVAVLQNGAREIQEAV